MTPVEPLLWAWEEKGGVEGGGGKKEMKEQGRKSPGAACAQTFVKQAHTPTWEIKLVRGGWWPLQAFVRSELTALPAALPGRRGA